MRPPPTVVAFDVIETLFSLENLSQRLNSIGLPVGSLQLWFAHILRDGFALDATDVYRPFREVASAALLSLLAEYRSSADPQKIVTVLDGFAELSPHPGADAAFRRLHEADIDIVTLTNGSASTTEKLLQNAGLRQSVKEVISVEEVRHWKPRREVYLYAARRLGVDPQHFALVATHAWDVHGAGSAGLTTAFVARGKTFPRTMMPPHITVESLTEAAAELVKFSQR
jgi:2-haloacid dehalogenase